MLRVQVHVDCLQKFHFQSQSNTFHLTRLQVVVKISIFPINNIIEEPLVMLRHNRSLKAWEHNLDPPRNKIKLRAHKN